jgi:type I restriction enzyme S subunit
MTTTLDQTQPVADSWSRKSLRDLGRWVGGGTPSKTKPQYWQNGTVPWVSPKDMKQERLSDSEDHITQVAVSESTTNLIPPGSVLVVTRSGILRHTLPVAVTGAPVTLNQDLKALTPKANVLPEYVAWGLRAFSQDILHTCSKHGTTVNSIETQKLLNYEIPVAPIEQQKRIVAEIEKQFSRLDEAVANLKRVKANLKRYKAAVLKAAVEGKLVPTEVKRWTGGTLGSVLTKIEAGKSFKCEERQPLPSEVGVVKVSAVTWGTFDERETKTCLDKSRVDERYFIKPGDFLFSRANTIELVGACVIAARITLKLMLSDKILRFRFTDAVIPQWILYWLRSEFGRAEIQRLSTGNQESMRNIGQDRIRQISIEIPPLPEQHRIVAEVERRLSVVEELEGVVDANLQRANRLRQAVLQRAFEGSLVNTESEKSVAREHGIF